MQNQWNTNAYGGSIRPDIQNLLNTPGNQYPGQGNQSIWGTGAPGTSLGDARHTGVGHYGPSLAEDMNARWDTDAGAPARIDRLVNAGLINRPGAPVQHSAFTSGSYGDVNQLSLIHI